jgi:ribonuclease P protein component
VSTIRSSREIERVFREGRRVVHPLVIVLVAPTPHGRDREGRVAFVAGKKIGGAVVRNRAKRVLRAGSRLAGGPWPGRDILLVARKTTPEASAPAAADAIRDALARVGEQV